MAIKFLTQTAAMMAVLTSARSFPDDVIFKQLDSVPQVSDEEAQIAKQIKQGLI